MGMAGLNILELPQDVLLLILLNLDPRDHLSFCQTSRLAAQEYRQDSLYWRTATASTFRLPISPLLAADGPRWYSLYKKLKTQTRLYTWGQGRKGNLGHGRAVRPFPGLPRGRGRAVPHRPIPPRIIFERVNSTWPTGTHVPDDVGIIADLQCGGWSTTILSAEGKLYCTGSLDSMNGITVGETTDQFKHLEYLGQTFNRIRQFSCGRRHILALTDDSEILSWDRINCKGLKVFSRNGRDFGGQPTRVAAGWDISSAYVPEAGIVYWKPVKNDQTDDMLDGLHVSEKVIPNTAHHNGERGSIEVTKHIVLAEYIVWITSDSKIFACRIGNEPEDQSHPNEDPFLVPGYTSDSHVLKDVQGQFQTFGVFTSTGAVLAGNVDYLCRCSDALRANTTLRDTNDWTTNPTHTNILASRPPDVPTLQHTGVVALAYGDHHYLALHANGRISTLGRDSGSCGQMGLGDPSTGARFRGLHRDVNNASRDAALLPLAERRGRQIWFEPEKKDWLAWMEDTIKSADFKTSSGEQGVRQWENLDRAALFSEWVDREGRRWRDGPSSTTNTSASAASSSSEKKIQAQKTTDYDHLEPYFAITVAAAGWHSGALVLVDEAEAHAVREKWLVKHEEDEEDAGPKMPGAFESKNEDEEYVWKRQGFPRVELSDGHVMPGIGEVRPWREGRPSMEELGLSETQ